MRCLSLPWRACLSILVLASCAGWSGCYTMVAHPEATPAAAPVGEATEPPAEPPMQPPDEPLDASPIAPAPVALGPAELLGDGIEMTLEMHSTRVAYRDELAIWFHLRNPFGFEHWVPFADQQWFSYRIDSQEMGRVSEGGGRFEGNCIARARNGDGLWAFVPGYGDCLVHVPIPPADYDRRYLTPGHYRVQLRVPRDLGRTYEFEFEIE